MWSSSLIFIVNDRKSLVMKMQRAAGALINSNVQYFLQLQRTYKKQSLKVLINTSLYFTYSTTENEAGELKGENDMALFTKKLMFKDMIVEIGKETGEYISVADENEVWFTLYSYYYLRNYRYWKTSSWAL